MMARPKQTKTDPCALSARDEKEDQFCNFGPRFFDYSRRSTICEYTGHQKWRTRLRTADNQPWTPIQLRTTCPAWKTLLKN